MRLAENPVRVFGRGVDGGSVVHGELTPRCLHLRWPVSVRFERGRGKKKTYFKLQGHCGRASPDRGRNRSTHVPT